MDLATLIGLVSGFILIFVTIILGSPIWLFVNIPSIFCVFGGTLAALLINFPMSSVMGIVTVMKNAFFVKDTGPENIIIKMVEFATIARREGILALESHVASAGDEFMSRSVQLAIDGTAPELIKDILTTEIAFMEDRHNMGVSVVDAAAVFGPAFGMIGTLIGLVQMLANMSDPSQIGPAMAVAILTTLYGSVQANLVCLPIVGKLKVRTANELLLKEIVIEGILSIQSGDNPRVVEQKLKAFISPAMRQKIVIGGAGGGN